MSIESKASSHFAVIGALFLSVILIINGVMLILPVPNNPDWVYWLSWAPAIVGFLAVLLSIKWLILEKVNNRG